MRRRPASQTPPAQTPLYMRLYIKLRARCARNRYQSLGPIHGPCESSHFLGSGSLYKQSERGSEKLPMQQRSSYPIFRQEKVCLKNWQKKTPKIAALCAKKKKTWCIAQDASTFSTAEGKPKAIFMFLLPNI